MERWCRQVAVVTGASAGIGACISEKLVLAGMKVVGLARRLDVLEEMEKNLTGYGQFHAMKCDLRSEEEILAAFKNIEDNLGPVHVLVNNAGYLVSEKIIDGSTENFRRILDINVLAVAICIREATKSMRKHDVHGHIININSLVGHNATEITVPISLYGASKYAITGMTETVRNDLSSLGSGIKITAISPGVVKTDMIRAFGITGELMEKGPFLEAKDVADAVIYALSTPAHVEIKELMLSFKKM